jgi:uncharacterized protein (DUF1800 family)
MEISRRDLIRTGVVVGATSAISGCSMVARQGRALQRADQEWIPPDRISSDDAHLLARLGFGHSIADLAMLQKMGRVAWIEAQLRAEFEEESWMMFEIRGMDIHQLRSMELRDVREDRVLQQMQTEAILRATYSPNQLKERMVDFWTNHFNIYGKKGLAAARKPIDEAEVIRKHALGNFKDMLTASAKSPAMLGYLDNRFNRKGVPNENYAREIMELHTLGVHGGYTQKDIQEVSRCFTGWTVEIRKGLDRILEMNRNYGEFRFDLERHDTGEKTVLGHRILAGRGIEDGEQVIDILVSHPSTAKHLASKLVRYFLGEEHPELVARAANAFQRSNGDIRETLRPIVSSAELLKAKPKFKRPFDYMVSCLRATNASTDAHGPLVDQLEKMGQPLYQWLMPDGYPDRNESWSKGLLPRWNFAIGLGLDAIKGVLIDRNHLGNGVELAHKVLATTDVPVEIQRAISGMDQHESLAMVLASPHFQWR